MCPGIAPNPGLGIYQRDDDPADLRQKKRPLLPTDKRIIAASQKVVAARQRRLDAQRSEMVAATTRQHCTVCGNQYVADFDPTAYDDPAERKKWRLWNRRLKCPECEAAQRDPDPQKKFCASCGIAIVRTDQNNKSWSRIAKCERH